MVMKKSFTITEQTACEINAQVDSWSDTTLGELRTIYSDIKKDSGINFDFLDKSYDNWIVKCFKEGSHHTDYDHCEYTIKIIDPKTKDCFIGGDTHNLVLGWSDIDMYFQKYNPKNETITITLAEYEELKYNSDFLKLLEDKYGLDNWTPHYQDAWKEMDGWED